MNLFGQGEWWEDYWRGMPEFIQPDAQPRFSLQVDFASKAAKEEFALLVGQKIADTQKQTLSIWHPAAEEVSRLDKRYVCEPKINPRYPVYVISKGRWDLPLRSSTIKSLETMGVPYYVAVEPQEADKYAVNVDPKKILVTPFSNLGQGSIPVRNFIWDHAISIGAKRHWCMDDNIQGFYRLNKNMKLPATSGNMFYAMEEIVDRYENVPIAGPNYWMFVPRKVKHPPFTLNTRVYSCILIDNSCKHRWRGRYNEDTDLSLRVLRDGDSTMLFYAFVADKTTTMTMKGGNTEELYLIEDGRLKMAKSLCEQHPDVATITWKWGRWQHHVNYKPFARNRPRLKAGVTLPEAGVVNNFGMELHYDNKETV